MKTKASHQRRGAALVELAVVLPVFLLLVFGSVEYGRYLMVRNTIDHAAREGARYAVVRSTDGSVTTTDITNHVQNQLGVVAQQLSALTIAVYETNASTGANVAAWTDAGFGEPIAVEITGTYQPILGSWLFLPSAMTMQARAIMDSEAN